jgi:putative ABC transport system permease protein
MVILGKLRALLVRGRLDNELREEVEAHIAQRRQSLIDDGMDPREAEYEARRMFGNVALIREETRDMWSVRWIDALVQDAGFAARLLMRTPLFTAAAVLSLGVGIGSAVAVFAVADAVMFRRLAVRAPEELLQFRGALTAGPMTKALSGVQNDALERIQRGADFADFAGFRLAEEISVETADAPPRAARAQYVSPNYFDVLGVPAAAGRTLSAEYADRTPVPIVITDRFSRAAFGTGGGAIGRTLSVNGQAATVIGVIHDFRGVVVDRPADLFVPLSATAAIEPALANTVIRLVGRRRPGVSVEVAEERFLPLFMGPAPSAWTAAGFKPENFRIQLADASRGINYSRGSMERPLRLGLGLVAALLFVACANTGGLLLSRFSTRRGEFGVRIAIGAARGRLARQLGVEALLIAVLAAVTGLVIGSFAAPLLISVIPQAGSQASFDLRLDRRLVAFTILVATASAFAVAAASLFRLWRSDTAALLHGETRTMVAGARRATRVLIAAQVTCSLVLVIGAVSMGRTLINLRHVPLGFDLERTFVVTVNATGLVDPLAADEYHGRLNQAVTSSAGVARATMAQVPPMTDSATSGTVQVAGFTPANEADRVTRMFFVGPHYFETLGMRIIAGRPISETDGTSRARVVVVNERFASFYFGSVAGALGQIVNRDTRIVGVAADARYNTVRDDVPRAMFVPYAQMKRSQMSHIVRASGDIGVAIATVREAIARHDPRLRPRISTAAELFGATLARERFFATIAVALSSLALLLACTGLYAAVAYGVSQRRGELAVRLALGATARDVVLLVLREPLITTLAGVAAGIPAAYVLMRSVSSLLFDVAVFDPVTIVGCAAGLIACGLLAAAWPARRATRVDPVATLRNS